VVNVDVYSIVLSQKYQRGKGRTIVHMQSKYSLLHVAVHGRATTVDQGTADVERMRLPRPQRQVGSRLHEVSPQTQRVEELAYQWTKTRKMTLTEPCSRI